MHSRYASSHTDNPLLLAPSSPLRELPASISRGQGIFFDAIRYTAQTAALSFSRLHWALENMSVQFRSFPRRIDEHLIVGALLDAWVIVDSANRLRAMLRQMPGWKKGASGAQAFERATRDVEALRNHFQHLNNEAPALVRDGRPLLGYVQWVSIIDDVGTARAYTLVPGTMVTFEQDIVVRKKEPLGGNVGQTRLVAANTTLWFDPLLNHISNLVSACESALSESAREGPRRHADVIVEIGLGDLILQR